MTTTLRTSDGDVEIELPPGATLSSGIVPPHDPRIGDLWLDMDGRLTRLTLRAPCPTCGRPGAETWEFVPDGLRTYAV